MVEYSQPNTHKAFHVGHMRNLCLGDSIIRSLRGAGYEVVAANYFGDGGTHIAKCLWGLEQLSPEQAIAPEEGRGEWLGKIYAQSAIALADLGTKSFQQLHARELGFVCSCLRRARVHGNDVDDLAQDVFVLAWRKRAEFAEIRSTRSWLYQCARRIAANHHRGCRRRVQREAEAIPAKPGHDGFHLPDQEDRVAAGEAAGFINKFVSGLDPVDRQLFEMSEVDGLAGPEVASRLGLNINTTYARIRAMRRRLRRAAATVVVLLIAAVALAIGDCALHGAAQKRAASASLQTLPLASPQMRATSKWASRSETMNHANHANHHDRVLALDWPQSPLSPCRSGQSRMCPSWASGWSRRSGSSLSSAWLSEFELLATTRKSVV